jgi:2-succinyl-5-enolpyruvyl-6-hydroxy-3-cyclohexene-1-carboxylate synthase
MSLTLVQQSQDFRLLPAVRFINRNHLWCQVTAEALAGMGIRDIVMHPGGRNAPLAFVAAQTEQFRVHTHVDERSGAFMALSLAQTAGLPVVLAATAGSAIANCLPALTEANKRNLPVILISGDRHRSTRHINLSQSSDQLGICAPLMRAQYDLPDPHDAISDLIALRRTVIDAVNQAAGGLRPGPVQINMPLWGGTCTTEPDAGWEALADPEEIRQAVPAQRLRLAAASLGEVERAARRFAGYAKPRGLIYCGPDTCAQPALVNLLAERTGFPVIADAASGVRKKNMVNLITVTDALHDDREMQERLARTQILLRFGGAPASPAMTKLAKLIRCPALRISQSAPGPDFWTSDATDLRPLDMAGAALLAKLLGAGDPDWLAEWKEIEARLSSRRQRIIQELPWGDTRAAGLACNAPGFDFIHIGNSLATRLSNLLAEGYEPAHREFIARGMAGTDGALGMFLGELLGTGGRGLLLVGDHSATHDLPALANPAWRTAKGAIAVVNNSGAGIFDTLACARIDGYASIMRNQPVIAFEHIAAAFGLQYRRCEDAASFRAALQDAAAAEGIILIEAVTAPGNAPRDIAAVLNYMGG